RVFQSIGGAVRCLAKREFREFFDAVIVRRFFQRRLRNRVISIQQIFSQPLLRPVRQPPSVSDFVANVFPADVSALSLRQSESARVFLDGGIQIFLKFRGLSQPFGRGGTGKSLIASRQILSSGIVIPQFEVRSEEHTSELQSL